MRTVKLLALIAGAVLVPGGIGGCYPLSMGIFTPIPIMPWVPERMEDKYCHKNDFRTPILPPINPERPPLCEDPPDTARVLRAWGRVTRGIPYVYEEFRDDIQVISERVKDTIDPPRFYPLIGPAQLHHCHWKCTIFYTETVESSYPFPFRCKRPRVEVILMDLDHLHLYPCGTPEGNQSITRDLSGY
jgi:hypothetical protein